MQDRGQDCDGGISLKRPPAAQHFIKHHAERENVGTRVDGFRFGLLGRHVGGRAQDRSGLRKADELSVIFTGLRRNSNLGKSKVKKLQPGRGHQNVCGLQVPMRDALLVRGIQGVANLTGVFQRPINRQRPLERRALDVLHHQIVRTNVVKLADVGMVQGRHGAPFTLEALRELFVYHLDCNNAVQPGVASAIDFAHAACANRFEQFIRTQPGSGSQCHRLIGPIVPWGGPPGPQPTPSSACPGPGKPAAESQHSESQMALGEQPDPPVVAHRHAHHPGTVPRTDQTRAESANALSSADGDTRLFTSPRKACTRSRLRLLTYTPAGPCPRRNGSQ